MQTRYQNLEKNRLVFQDLGDQEGWGFAFERSMDSRQSVAGSCIRATPRAHIVGLINNSLSLKQIIY